MSIVMFYSTVAAAVATAVAAPMYYHKTAVVGISNALSFASSVCSVVTASQLAARVLQLGRGQNNAKMQNVGKYAGGEI